MCLLGRDIHLLPVLTTTYQGMTIPGSDPCTVESACPELVVGPGRQQPETLRSLNELSVDLSTELNRYFAEGGKKVNFTISITS